MAPALSQTSDIVSKTQFRVCADPANFPISDTKGDGFENRLAVFFAERLDLPLVYEWYPMSTGFVRNTLQANRCDVVIGFAQGHELVRNTNHYYTSVFVLVVPPGSALTEVEGLDDPALRGKRLGIVAGTPPASHLVRHGLIASARSYQLFTDRRYRSPVTDMLDDLRDGEIDGALLWGPIGGPLVKANYPGMAVIPLTNEVGSPRLFYRITMGVRRGERAWARRLNSLIRRNQDEIDAILLQAGVPLTDEMGTAVLGAPE